MVIFGVTLVDRLQEAEMLQHRVVGGKADLSGDLQRLRLGLHALELDAVLGLDDVDAVERAEEIEMPPGAAELAVGHRLQPDRLLLRDDVADQPVLDGAKRVGADLALGPRGARLLELRRPQQAADLVGAKRRFARHAEILLALCVRRTMARPPGYCSRRRAARRWPMAEIAGGNRLRNLRRLNRWRCRATSPPSRNSTRAPRKLVPVSVRTSVLDRAPRRARRRW